MTGRNLQAAVTGFRPLTDAKGNQGRAENSGKIAPTGSQHPGTAPAKLVETAGIQKLGRTLYGVKSGGRSLDKS